MRLTLAATAFALAIPAATSAMAADPFGFWLTENKKAIVEIAPCGEQACGRIAWLEEPNAPDGTPKVDAVNPEAALKSRPVCGLPLVGNFSKDTDGQWTDGFIYDPEGGDTYKAFMRITDEGNLYVKGYIGISLFGRSQVWTPEQSARSGC